MIGNGTIAGHKIEVKIDKTEVKIDLDKGNKFDNTKLSKEKLNDNQEGAVESKRTNNLTKRRCGCELLGPKTIERKLS